MFSVQQKFTRHVKKQQSEETKPAMGPDSDMAEIWGLSDQEFKVTIINMLRALIEKVDNMQEQMSNVSREMKTLRKNQKEMIEIKNIVTEMTLWIHQ